MSHYHDQVNVFALIYDYMTHVIHEVMGESRMDLNWIKVCLVFANFELKVLAVLSLSLAGAVGKVLRMEFHQH